MIPISEDEDKHHPKQRRSSDAIVLNVDVREERLSTQIAQSGSGVLSSLRVVWRFTIELWAGGQDY